MYLVNSEQLTFILGKMLTNNVIVVHEVVHSLIGARRSSYSLKLVIFKAYNKVRWSFLEDALLKLGISLIFSIGFDNGISLVKARIEKNQIIRFLELADAFICLPLEIMCYCLVRQI